jgi:F-type H+-transporting ATPase subunit epsilon
MSLTVHIITPEKALPVDVAEHVTLPGSEGELGIRTGHAPITALLKVGKVDIKHATKPASHYVINGGVAQVLKDEVRILTPGLVEVEAVSEAQLLKRLNELEAKTYEDALELSKAKAEAHWLITQLRMAGKDVPTLTKLGA